MILTFSQKEQLGNHHVKTFRQSDVVRVTSDVVATEGVDVAAGAIGVIVQVWAGGLAYEVEILAPYEALATIAPEMLEFIRHGDPVIGTS